MKNRSRFSRTGLILLAFAAVAFAQVRSVPPASAVQFEFSFPATNGSTQHMALDHFLFNGQPFTSAANAARTHQLSPGVSEISIDAQTVGEWEFDLGDDSSYFGLGERFDRLNHAHSIVRNGSRDAGNAKGANTYQPVPFFMSLRGYGLWVDTTSEATFDFNLTERYRVRIKTYGRNLRLVLIEGPRFPLILDRFTALVGRQELPPYWAFAPWKSRDYHRNRQEVEEDIDRYRALGLPASIIMIDRDRKSVV